jgi:hypothetical protein
MGRNGMNDDAPAADAVLPVDDTQRPGRRGDFPSVVGSECPATSGRSVSPQRASHRRIGRPTRLTARLAKVLVKTVAEAGRIEPAARRCGVPHQTVCDWIAVPLYTPGASR